MHEELHVPVENVSQLSMHCFTCWFVNAFGSENIN